MRADHCATSLRRRIDCPGRRPLSLLDVHLCPLYHPYVCIYIHLSSVTAYNGLPHWTDACWWRHWSCRILLLSLASGRSVFTTSGWRHNEKKTWKGGKLEHVFDPLSERTSPDGLLSNLTWWVSSPTLLIMPSSVSVYSRVSDSRGSTLASPIGQADRPYNSIGASLRTWWMNEWDWDVFSIVEICFALTGYCST